MGDEACKRDGSPKSEAGSSIRASNTVVYIHTRLLAGINFQLRANIAVVYIRSNVICKNKLPPSGLGLPTERSRQKFGEFQ